jgi:hypothetical protein
MKIAYSITEESALLSGTLRDRKTVNPGTAFQAQELIGQDLWRSVGTLLEPLEHLRAAGSGVSEKPRGTAGWRRVRRGGIAQHSLCQ